MLSKLGWNKGEVLGKTQDSGGLLEPVDYSNFFPKNNILKIFVL